MHSIMAGAGHPRCKAWQARLGRELNELRPPPHHAVSRLGVNDLLYTGDRVNIIRREVSLTLPKTAHKASEGGESYTAPPNIASIQWESPLAAAFVAAATEKSCPRGKKPL